MEHVTGTLIAYYFYCKRRMWLHANEIRFEDNSEDVAMGKLIGETTYLQRNSNYEQIEFDGIKIDYYDYKKKIIHETKKSPKFEETHIWQLKYYIYILKKNGIEGVKGILEYPTERIVHHIELHAKDIGQIELISKEIISIIKEEICPPIIRSPKCKGCSYYEFCFAKEEDEK